MFASVTVPVCVSVSQSIFVTALLITDDVTGAELMLFGSSANEFGSPASDIDISMKLPRNFDVGLNIYDH